MTSIAVGNHLSEQEIDLSLPRWDSGLSLSDAIYRATSPLTSRAPRPVR